MTVGIGIYSGGDPYIGTQPYQGSQAQQLFSLITTAGYTTVVIWAAHIDGSGNIKINDSLVILNGSFQSAAQDWATQVAALKTAKGTKITRLELSIGGDQTSFANIKSLMTKYGTGSNNPLYKGLSILQSKLGLDAVNYDDETEFDLPSSEGLASICVDLNMKVSACAIGGSQDYWVNLITAVNKAKPGAADAVYIMTYGGADPVAWNGYMKSTGLVVAPGLWACHYDAPGSTNCTSSTNASQVETQIAAWKKQTSLDGGWMFCGTDMQHCPIGGTVAEYASAICNGLGNTNC
jgi:hypothetical protein